MEAVANAAEDRLIDGLSFKLKPGASYVTDRRSVTFHPQGSNHYSPTGTKAIKILLSGDQWLDPSTVRLMFDVHNPADPAKLLRPLGGPHTFFRRMRILCGGTVVEDIDNYSRVHELMKMLTAKDKRVNDDAEAFGQSWDKYSTLNVDTLPGIIGGQSQTVLMTLCSGLLSQPKMLPIRNMPITIELEVDSNVQNPILTYLPGGGGTNFDAANTSEQWVLQNVQVKCDVVTLDNQLDNSFTSHLLEGKALPINFQTYISQMQTVQGGTSGSTILGQQKIRLSVTRALSRLKNAFVTFYKEPANNAYGSRYKEWNSFYSPMEAHTGDTMNIFDSSGEISDFQIQVGNKNFPETSMRSLSECYYQLRKTLGSHTQHNSIDISQHEYRCRKFVIGLDMEKVLEAGFTGLNSRNGDIMSIRSDFKDTTAANWPTQMHIVLTSDCVLECRDSGCQVFD